MGTERKSGWQSYDEVKRCRILEVKKDSLILSDPIVEVELPYHVQYTEGDKFNIESPSIHFDKETKTIKAVGYSMDWMKFADGINDCTKHLYTFKFSDGRYELLEEEEISEIRKG